MSLWQYIVKPIAIHLTLIAKTMQVEWPQLRRAPIKFGWFIKLYNIDVKVLYKQANMGFAAEAGFFLGGGGRGRFAQKKGVTLHPRATDFREKKILRKLNTYCKLL